MSKIKYPQEGNTNMIDYVLRRIHPIKTYRIQSEVNETAARLLGGILE